MKSTSQGYICEELIVASLMARGCHAEDTEMSSDDITEAGLGLTVSETSGLEGEVKEGFSLDALLALLVALPVQMQGLKALRVPMMMRYGAFMSGMMRWTSMMNVFRATFLVPPHTFGMMLQTKTIVDRLPVLTQHTSTEQLVALVMSMQVPSGVHNLIPGNADTPSRNWLRYDQISTSLLTNNARCAARLAA